MSKATAKTLLKAAKAAIGAEKWEEGRDLALKVLDADPSNYYGNIFLGVSQFRLHEVPDAENAYRAAIKSNPSEVMGWQGLITLYEETQQIDEYLDAVKELAAIYIQKEDRTRCDTLMGKVLPLVETRGTRAQQRKALALQVPDSPIFDFLQGMPSIPPPDVTYQQLAAIVELEEKEYINSQIASRKSRLGATERGVTVQVKQEVWGKSPLQDIYAHIINWTKDDQVRRDTEAKQLKLGYNYLEVLPAAEKAAQRAKVLEWAKGIVILKVPLELAWKIEIEWQDHKSISHYDVSLFRNYVELFPNAGLAAVLRAYLESEISPFPAPNPDELDEEDGGVSLLEDIGPDERLDFIIDGLDKDKSSILGHRILAEYYLMMSEYENAVDTCRRGLTMITKQAQISGLKLQKSFDAMNVLLATALIHYQAPRHHKEAKASFENILTRDPKNTGALIGLGMILEDQGEFLQASGFLQKALLSDPENLKVISEAAWCEIQQGHYDVGIGELQGCLGRITGVDPQSRDLKAQVLWRIGSALWESQPSNRSDRDGAYFHFMQALRSNPNFAPAFTSLGIYYADIAGDTERANKCFQKAFELSSGEYEAAERLARNFADTKDWELVEIVARRAAEADKKRTAVGKTASWPQVALGVVELNNLNFPMAIQAFQAALRNSPKDVHSWIGLGEAYTNSGRYIAAMKAFKQAKSIDPDNWFITYMMSNVERELGDFDAACDGYREVLEKRPDEFGVLIALAETLVTASFNNLNTGLYGRAAESAREALLTARAIAKNNAGAFNLWKLVGDACSVFSWIQSLLDQFPADEVESLLTMDIDTAEFDIISDLDTVGASKLSQYNALSLLDKCLLGSIFAYKRGIYASIEDRQAHAVAWYNLGTAEYRALLCPVDRQTKFRTAAISCFRRAIALEPGNSDFWNALGVATSDVNAQAAQHAFVRALHINEKNARIWTNLGTLYLLHDDTELANEAFTRGQSADPDYSHAWVGQGLVALAANRPEEAPGLFEHAFQLSATESYSSIIRTQFASTAFDVLLEQHRTDSSLTSLLSPMFASHQLIRQRTADPMSLRLAGLFEERAGDFEGAVAKLNQVCDILEARYEESEASEDLVMYAQATADRARCYLGLKDYQSAIDSATLSFDLSQDVEARKSRLSAHLTAGLAYYFTKQIDESLEMFRIALTESGEDPDVVALLAQVLWAKGGEAERGVALEQLMGSIEKNPDHLLSTMLLGVIGAMEKDEGIIESVVEDLETVRGDSKRASEDIKRVNKLLLSLGSISGRDVASACTTSIFLTPASSAAWEALAGVSGERFPADMALDLALSKPAPDVGELCEAFEASGSLDHDQMSVLRNMVKLTTRQTTHEQWLSETCSELERQREREPSLVPSEPLSDGGEDLEICSSSSTHTVDAAREDSMYFSCEEEKTGDILPSLDEILANLTLAPSTVPNDDELPSPQEDAYEECETELPVVSARKLKPAVVTAVDDSDSDEDFIIGCRRRATVLGSASPRRTKPLAVNNDSDADGEVFTPAKSSRRKTHDGFLSPSSAVKLNRAARWMPPTLFEDQEDVQVRERLDRSPRKQRSLAMTPKIVKKVPVAAAPSTLQSSDEIDALALDLQGLAVGDEHLIDFIPNKFKRPPKIIKRASSSIFDLTDSESENESGKMEQPTAKTAPLEARTPAKTPRGKPKAKAPAASTVERLRRKDFEANRERFAKDYLKLLDDTVNDGAVNRITSKRGGLQLVWTNQKRTTAGTCQTIRYTQGYGDWEYACTITLEAKVCDDFDRVKEALAHEYTHACVDVLEVDRRQLNNEGPHGRSFKAWAKKVGKAMGIPIPETCHNMTINYKFEYQCPSCTRVYKAHSRKKDWTTTKGCERCKCPLVQIKPVPRTAKKDGTGAAAETGGLTAYQAFQKETFAKLKAELPPGTPFKLGEMQKEVTRLWKERKARVEAGGVSSLQAKLKAAQTGDAAAAEIIEIESDDDEEDDFKRVEKLVITLDD
ncbi:hypothetical protein Dda_2628 [Drechslerella dactyloides]|uniref:SprT-like domain-containing protein n=1 Tax=Drechslerella dactyloides TaxID=74499 RepID=A0AAD6J1D2_DREDA|nr:hypothetical protein Dda_2628 [Drechslerella dactyloides]